MTVDELKKKFLECYGGRRDAVHAYFSPGRVNLIGEHTDYNGGFVLPCALRFGTYLLVRQTEDNTVTLRSLNQVYSARIPRKALQVAHGNEWVNYPLGVMDQFIKRGFKINTGLEMLYWGNVPGGAGLSSSAALEVVTAFAVNTELDFKLERRELVKISQQAENVFVGVNCGVMDQFASCMGKMDHAMFLNCDTLDFEYVPVRLDGVKIVISNTNSPHKLDAGQYNQRVAECKKAVAQINTVKRITCLGELDTDGFHAVETSITDPVAKKRARHVVSEIRRTFDSVRALKTGRIEVFGTMMNASHISLRDDYEVTGPELDAMVEQAWKVNGVIGSRMTGAGFGGCTVSLVRQEAIETYIKEVGENYEQITGLNPEFHVVEIGEGTRKI